MEHTFKRCLRLWTPLQPERIRIIGHVAPMAEKGTSMMLRTRRIQRCESPICAIMKTILHSAFYLHSSLAGGPAVTQFLSTIKNQVALEDVDYGTGRPADGPERGKRMMV